MNNITNIRAKCTTEAQELRLAEITTIPAQPVTHRDIHVVLPRCWYTKLFDVTVVRFVRVCWCNIHHNTFCKKSLKLSFTTEKLVHTSSFKDLGIYSDQPSPNDTAHSPTSITVWCQCWNSNCKKKEKQYGIMY